jgi:hypothetical protein
MFSGSFVMLIGPSYADPPGAAADPGWPRTRSGPSGHRTHVEIGSREGPVAGPLIGMSSLSYLSLTAWTRQGSNLFESRMGFLHLTPVGL